MLAPPLTHTVYLCPFCFCSYLAASKSVSRPPTSDPHPMIGLNYHSISYCFVERQERRRSPIIPTHVPTCNPMTDLCSRSRAVRHAVFDVYVAGVLGRRRIMGSKFKLQQEQVSFVGTCRSIIITDNQVSYRPTNRKAYQLVGQCETKRNPRATVVYKICPELFRKCSCTPMHLLACQGTSCLRG